MAVEHEEIPLICMRLNVLWKIENSYEVSKEDAASINWLLEMQYISAITHMRSVKVDNERYFLQKDNAVGNKTYCISEGGRMLLSRMLDVKLPTVEVTTRWV